MLVEVDKRIVKELKPHQAQGIKFMWDAVFESKKKLEEGEFPGGAILAHCMGLGKTLQTIGLVHTVHTTFEEQVVIERASDRSSQPTVRLLSIARSLASSSCVP